MEYIYNVNKNIENTRYVVIYGAGSSGENLFSQLLCDNVRVDFFCDSDNKKWGKKIMGKEIISPQQLLKIKDESAVLIASIYTEEISKMLIDMGIMNLYVTRKDTFGGIY